MDIRLKTLTRTQAKIDFLIGRITGLELMVDQKHQQLRRLIKQENSILESLRVEFESGARNTLAAE